LEEALAKLEQQIASSHEAERELDQQRSENMFLKETIDKLKIDLDDIRSGKAARTNEFEVEDPRLPVSSTTSTFANFGTSKTYFLALQTLETELRAATGEEIGSDENAEDPRSSRVRVLDVSVTRKRKRMG
jgi:hypothetical protein